MSFALKPSSQSSKNLKNREYYNIMLSALNSYDFPILGFLPLLRFLRQPDSHLSEESPTARDIYL